MIKVREVSQALCSAHRADVYTKLSGNNYLIFTRSNCLTIR